MKTITTESQKPEIRCTYCLLFHVHLMCHKIYKKWGQSSFPVCVTRVILLLSHVSAISSPGDQSGVLPFVPFCCIFFYDLNMYLHSYETICQCVYWIILLVCSVPPSSTHFRGSYSRISIWVSLWLISNEHTPLWSPVFYHWGSYWRTSIIFI